MKVSVQSIFLSHTQIFKERSNQRLEINTHHANHGVLISKLYLQEADHGGAKRDRTADLLRARQALSQLSYGPVSLQGAPVIGGSGQIRTADLTLIRGAL